MTITFKSNITRAAAQRALDLWILPENAYIVLLNGERLGIVASVPKSQDDLDARIWLAEAVTDGTGSLREFESRKEASEALMAKSEVRA